MINRFRICLVSIALAQGAVVHAQEAAVEPEAASLAGEEVTDSGVTSYPASFFIEQGAVTALDMMRILPGFNFRDVESSRGYAGAAGNVLINGRRPSTKTTPLRILLMRVPTEGVERIDIIRGGASGIDMQGLPVVANIVRVSGVSRTNALDGILKFYPGGDTGGIFRAETSRRSDESSVEGSFEYRMQVDEREAGEGDIVRSDSDGNVLEQGSYLADYWNYNARALGNYEKNTDSGLFRLNGALSRMRNEDRDAAVFEDIGEGVTRNETDKTLQIDRFEISGDYDRDLGEGQSLELVAIQTLEHKTDDSVRETPGRVQVSGEDANSGESILRGAWQQQRSAALIIEAGGEVAYNFLDSEFSLTDNDEPVDLPAANIKVEELRGELFTTVSMRPADTLSLDAGLRLETSEISTSGDSDASNRFSFIKPRFSATYSPGGGAQYRVRVEREVGQLDFEDFAASGELSSGAVNAGNPDIEPERAWVYEAAYERVILGDGAISVTYTYFDLEEVIDFVPVDGFAAPGNIGDGERQQLVVSLGLPLDAIGPGLGRLAIDGTWRDSEIVDPVTGERREISGEPRFEGNLLYTRDFPSLNSTLGIRTELADKQTDYRLNQVIREENSGYWRLYWDWRIRPDLFFRAQYENVLSREHSRTQTFYDGPRSDGIVSVVQHREAILDPFIMLRLRWTF